MKKPFPSSLLHQGAKKGEAPAWAALPGSGSRQLSLLLHGTLMASLQSFVKVDLQKQPITHITVQSSSHIPLGKQAAEAIWVRASSQKISPKEPHIPWRLLMSLCNVQKGPAPAGVNPSQYTSDMGAINRPQNKTKGSFLKMEDTTGPVSQEWELQSEGRDSETF